MMIPIFAVNFISTKYLQLCTVTFGNIIRYMCIAAAGNCHLHALIHRCIAATNASYSTEMSHKNYLKYIMKYN